MRKVGLCACGSRGYKIKYGASVCQRCDKIESENRGWFKELLHADCRIDVEKKTKLGRPCSGQYLE